MDIADAISAFVEVMARLIQLLIEAIVLPIKFALSRDYRIRKYKQWEESAWRRVCDIVSVVATTALIAVGTFWIWQLFHEPKRGSGCAALPQKPTSSVEIVFAETGGQQRVAFTLDGDDLGRALTSRVAKAAFSNAAAWIKKKKEPPSAPLVPGSRATPPADAGAAPQEPAGEP